MWLAGPNVSREEETSTVLVSVGGAMQYTGLTKYTGNIDLIRSILKILCEVLMSLRLSRSCVNLTRSVFKIS